MTVHVLIREDRNHYGYIDTSIIGIYREIKSTRLERRQQRRCAIADGRDVNYDNPDADSWEVFWKLEAREVE